MLRKQESKSTYVDYFAVYILDPRFQAPTTGQVAEVRRSLQVLPDPLVNLILVCVYDWYLSTFCGPNSHYLSTSNMKAITLNRSGGRECFWL